MYESPIELTTDIKVNKDELIRALQYDRNQYEKGYSDGYAEGANTMLNKVKECLHDLVEVKYLEDLYKETVRIDE